MTGGASDFEEKKRGPIVGRKSVTEGGVAKTKNS